MPARKKDLDVELERLYHGPLAEFTRARNDLAKQLRKLGSAKEAEYVRTLPKPTPSAWAVSQLFEREPARMETLLAAGKRARAGQREAVSGRGADALRESLQAARGVMDDLRRRAAEILRESGGSASRAMLDRIATDLQALAFSPAASEAADRRWLSRDLDPPGFEVLAGLQLAGAPVVDLAARKAERQETKRPQRHETPKVVPKPKEPARDAAREARERKEAVERARREREEERIRRRVEVAQEKVNRARGEAEDERQHAEKAEKTAAEARRQADAAELAARRAREKADRAADRLARAQEELQEARGGG